MKKLISSNNLRKKRVRRKLSIVNRKNLPRLSVFRSNKKFYAQIIDDSKGITLASANDHNLKNKKNIKKTEKAFEVGKKIFENAKKAKVDRVIFDRGPYAFRGRVKEFADSARKSGLKF